MSGVRLIDQAQRTIGVPSRALVTQSANEVWAMGFTDVGSLTPDLNNLTPASPMTVTQTGGNLTIATGVAANAEFLARFESPFTGPMLWRQKTILSQRIANQNFAVLLADKIGDNLATVINSATQITVTAPAHGFTSRNVGQSMFIGGIVGAAGAVPGRYALASVPDANTLVFTVAGWPASGTCTVDLFGWNYYRMLYNGVTATAMAVDAQRRGWASGDTTATINTTASSGHLAQARIFPRNVYFEDSLPASATAPAFTTRASRYENIPDEDVPLYVYLWAWNGATAPASTTTWTLGFVSVEDLSDNRVTIAGVDQLGQSAPLPVTLGAGAAAIGTVTLGAGAAAIGTVTLGAGAAAIGTVALTPLTTSGDTTTLSRILTADTNLAVVKAAAGRLGALIAHNDSATKFYLKVYNKATAPTPGTDTPVLRVPVPPNSTVELPLGAAGLRLSAGIAIAVTRGLADADTTAVAASDGVINAVYT